MPEDSFTHRPLFGGAITATFPLRFLDASNIREVPDNEEMLFDPRRDESFIIEILDFKDDVADHESATWFFHDLATGQDAEGAMVSEQSGIFDVEGLRFGSAPAVINTAVGQMNISKERQGREAQNVVKVYLANVRLKEVATDLLITAYEPLVINPLSGSAASVGAGLAAPAAEAGVTPMQEVFRTVLSTFKVKDWSLFG